MATALLAQGDTTGQIAPSEGNETMSGALPSSFGSLDQSSDSVDHSEGKKFSANHPFLCIPTVGVSALTLGLS